ncbi:carnitine 3-dehydrogenase [Acidisoma cellulosilytica]|uniref:L-carnitine dehydrogenase n=1 Tax=Acidisoma cellulosilyticum TaxID=2802395 RepID=A0A963Z356_9PROT|nr:carnitine 3-dehydrogenase [Acidisoma cellulosilyticum]MCB8881634.1 carnitine 3-dehydrogenase [Acidisoma cellulosilyticum]
MTAIRHCAIIGGGVIGGGWAARFLLAGLDVTVFDPHPEAERRLREMVKLAGRAWAKLIAAPLPPLGHLHVAVSLEEAVRDADLIQESAPEVEAIKQKILAEIDRFAKPDALICSSTSGLLPTQISAMMARPERFMVAHPFNPVYLLPLVELCGGEKTSADNIARAKAFFADIGMHPLHVRKEIDGFIADRLLEALWREALWLVHDGVATVAEVDDAIRFGAGMRWAFMGTFQIYRLAGGEAGMRHFMAQFGPTLKLPWTKLMDVPDFTDALVDLVAEQSDDQSGQWDFRALEAKRDDCLIGIMRSLKVQDFGAGATLAGFEKALRDRATDGDAEPLRLYEGQVPAEWIDYNGHMNESRYLEIFGYATDALLARIGMDDAMLEKGFSYYTVETHLRHLDEIKLGESYVATTQILAHDEKRIHIFHRLLHGDGRLLATAEQMMLCVDMKAHRATPAAPETLSVLQGLAAGHRALPMPDGAGRSIGQR